MGLILPPDDSKTISIAHAINPESGDYWHEMFNPIALVIAVSPFNVTLLQKRKDVDSAHWTWDTSVVTTKTRNEFAAWLQYGSIPGTWCRVVPNWKPWKEFAAAALAHAQTFKDKP